MDAQKNTDQLSKAFATSADKFDELDLAGGKALLLQVRKDLNQLSEARGSAYTNIDNIQATVLNYDVIIKGLIGITEEIAIASNSTELIKITRALSQFALSKENASMQRALISAALARPQKADLSPRTRPSASGCRSPRSPRSPTSPPSTVTKRPARSAPA
ncbi:nitrate- and nitrite sensing domain-containing protein [Kitasatospora arboriphila]